MGKKRTREYLQQPWMLFAIVGLALCFLFRDTNRYTTITFPNSDSLIDPIILAFGRLLPLVILVVAYAKMKPSSPGGKHRAFVPRIWTGLFVSHTSRILTIAFITTVGIGILFISEFGVYPTTEVITMGKLFLGLGNTLFVVTYAEFLLPNGRETTVVAFLGASYLYGILRMLLGLLTPETALILLFVCPALSCLCLHEALRPREGAEDATASGNPMPQPPSSEASVSKGFVASLLIGISGYTFLSSELHSIWANTTSETAIFSVLVQIATGAGIVLGTFVIGKLRDYLSIEYSSSYSLLLPSLYIFILYLGTFLVNIWIVFYVILLYSVQRIIFFLIWNFALFYFFPKERIKAFCMGMLCLEGGTFVYRIFVAVYAGLHVQNTNIPTIVLSGVLAFLVGKEIFTWFLAKRRESAANKRAAQEAQAAETNERELGEIENILLSKKLEDAFDAIAAFYHLTKRERELLPYLMISRPPEYIGRALYIEPSTVKTHIKNIYRKTNVRKRAELIQLVETWDAEAAAPATENA